MVGIELHAMHYNVGNISNIIIFLNKYQIKLMEWMITGLVGHLCISTKCLSINVYKPINPSSWYRFYVNDPKLMGFFIWMNRTSYWSFIISALNTKDFFFKYCASFASHITQIANNSLLLWLVEWVVLPTNTISFIHHLIHSYINRYFVTLTHNHHQIFEEDHYFIQFDPLEIFYRNLSRPI